ncbi:MAG: hypothetical protein ACRCWO_07905 [Bosea sp. (in: a-proteobacteria)]
MAGAKGIRDKMLIFLANAEHQETFPIMIQCAIGTRSIVAQEPFVCHAVMSHAVSCLTAILDKTSLSPHWHCHDNDTPTPHSIRPLPAWLAMMRS